MPFQELTLLKTGGNRVQSTRTVPQQQQREGRTTEIKPKVATNKNPNTTGENVTA